MKKYIYNEEITYDHEFGGVDAPMTIRPCSIIEHILESLAENGIELSIPAGTAVQFAFSQSNRGGNYYYLYNPTLGFWETHAGTAASKGFARQNEVFKTVPQTTVCGWTIVG